MPKAALGCEARKKTGKFRHKSVRLRHSYKLTTFVTLLNNCSLTNLTKSHSLIEPVQ